MPWPFSRCIDYPFFGAGLAFPAERLLGRLLRRGGFRVKHANSLFEYGHNDESSNRAKARLSTDRAIGAVISSFFGCAEKTRY